MKGNKHKGILIAFSVVLTLSLVVTLFGSCKQAAQPPAKGGEILIGLTGPLTGPAAPTAIPIVEGLSDLTVWVNKQGGIAGNNLKVIYNDDMYSPPKAIAAYEQFKNVDKVHAVSVVSSVASILIAPMAREDKMIVIGGAEPAALFIPPMEESYYFGYGPPYYSYFASGVKWFHDKHWKGTEPPRIGTLQMDSGAGRSALQGIYVGCERVGWPTPVVDTWCVPFATNVQTQVTELKNADVDYVMGTMIDQPSIAYLKDAHRVGLKVPTFLFPSANTMGVIKATPDIGEGTMTFGLVSVWDETDNKGIQMLHQLNAEIHPDVTYREFFYVMSFSIHSTLVEGLRLTVEKNGYEGLTGPNIKAGLESVKDWTAYDLILPTTVTLREPWLISGMKIYARQGESVHDVSGWIPLDPLTDEELQLDYWKQRPWRSE